jgi:hypothetical protein
MMIRYSILATAQYGLSPSFPSFHHRFLPLDRLRQSIVLLFFFGFHRDSLDACVRACVLLGRWVSILFCTNQNVYQLSNNKPKQVKLKKTIQQTEKIVHVNV